MTQFEKKYILHCLDVINNILSNPATLTKAILAYSSNKSDQARYQSNRQISDSAHWTTQDIMSFTAAVFEANAQASIKFCTSPELIKPVNQASTLLQNKYVPLITAKTERKDPLDSVRKNIARLLEEINAESYSITDYSFFSAAIAVGAAVAVVAAATFANRN